MPYSYLFPMYSSIDFMEPSKTSTGANGKRRLCYKWRWTPEEDDLLTMLVKIHGPRKWDYIAQHIEGRTGKSCRLRWINQLDPKVDKTPFNEVEQLRLLQLHEKYGNKWSIIVTYFPGRTDNHVKNQYHALVGTRYMKSSVPSSSTLGCRSTSTVPVGSQLSYVSFEGNNNCGFAPSSITMPDVTEMMPLFTSGSSSNLGRHCFDSVNMANIYPRQGISRGDSIMSDANSAALSELCPVPQPEQGVGVKNDQFIDFLGVGSSN